MPPLGAGSAGTHTTDGRPHSFTTLTPFLAVSGARNAIEFYRTVFGAHVLDVTEMCGVIAHAELNFGEGRLQLGEANPDYGLIPQSSTDEACFSLGVYCADVDAVVARAEEAGATVREPVAEFVSGDRFASIKDPFGVRWSVMSRVADLSDAESAQRVAAWAASQEG
ncbi:VOC family protein [Corynebacterium sp. A21]|uniref:VOC family protein n=1 Tax=Corynebacterium sp. A21 TaxID=3457318 RepID=UPI003FD4A98E